MLILALDTSGQHGSMGLVRGANEPFEVLEEVSLTGRTYSARLLPELSGMLARRHLQLGALEGFAVISGPGSFTGLRVGLSSIKALAEILGRPIAAISMLEAVAAQADPGPPDSGLPERQPLVDRRVIAALDAGRKEVYVGCWGEAGEYGRTGAGFKLARESLLSRAEFISLLEANAVAELVTPDRALCELAAGRLRTRLIPWPAAGEIARLGLAKLAAGQTVPVEALDANYIRRSDAEIFSTPQVGRRGAVKDSYRG
jgi:tRNA threonylcarbamoyladenosine biosynthesis protein TsaB